MRILIVEPHATGHHASYLRWLVQGAVQRRWSVAVATTREALAHPTVAGIADDFHDVRIHIMDDVLPRDGPSSKTQLMRREFEYWKAFKRVAAEVRSTTSVDAAILPYVDYCFHALAILGSPFKELPWSGISMRLTVRSDATKRRFFLPFKWRFAIRLLSDATLKALFVINPSVQDTPSNWGSYGLLSKLRYLRDPADFRAGGTRVSARATLGIADDRVAMLVFGSIDERKGIDALVQQVASQDGLDNYVVILAGKESATLRDQLRATPCAELLSQKRLIVMDRFLSDEEQDLVFAAADVVWVGYRNHQYMSGVLVLAGRAGLPVVGTPVGEIGRLIVRYNIGITASIGSPTDVTSALRALLDVRTRIDMGRRARAAFAGHTVDDFAATVMGAFNSLPSTPC